jgi:hypothetical protein
MNVFSPQQLQALALLFLKVNGPRGAAMALAFFGFEALLNGYLIFRSALLPRILGVLSILPDHRRDATTCPRRDVTAISAIWAPGI